MFFDGEERLAGDAIEEIDDALLGGLRDRVGGLAIVRYGEKRRRSGEVAIPDVVMDALEMPEALAGVGVEGEQRVGEEVVAEAIATVEIKDSRASGRVENAAFGIESHAGPVVCGSGGLPRTIGPGFVAKFAGMRNRVEGPAQGPAVHVEGANVARGRGMGFRIASADDDEVFVDEAGGGKGDGLLLVTFAVAQAFAEVEAALVAEGWDQMAGAWIDCVEIIHASGEEARFVAVGPVAEAARRLSGAADGGVVHLDGGIEEPETLAGGGIEREDFAAVGEPDEGAANDERIRFEIAFLAGVINPRLLEMRDVCAVDLREHGIVIAVDVTVVRGPVGILRVGGGGSEENGQSEETINIQRRVTGKSFPV